MLRLGSIQLLTLVGVEILKIHIPKSMNPDIVIRNPKISFRNLCTAQPQNSKLEAP